jgi:hypothetical protein
MHTLTVLSVAVCVCTAAAAAAACLAMQLFHTLQEFLQAAGLMKEFEFIKLPNSSRRELVLRQQPSLQQQQQQSGREQQLQQHDELHVHGATEQPSSCIGMRLQGRLAVAELETLPSQHAGHICDASGSCRTAAAGFQAHSAEPAAAAAAAVYESTELLMVLEAVHALQLQDAYDRPVPMRAVMDSTAAADGDGRTLFQRLGGSGAAAVAFLWRWPYVFDVRPVALQHPGVGGVRTGFQVQLQQGAVQWLMSTQHFRQELAGYKAALLAAMQEAAAAAGPGKRRGVDFGQVGNSSGCMPASLVPFRQVSGSRVKAPGALSGSLVVGPVPQFGYVESKLWDASFLESCLWSLCERVAKCLAQYNNSFQKDCGRQGSCNCWARTTMIAMKLVTTRWVHTDW